MVKVYLLGYNIEQFEALNSNGTTFILNFKKVWLWGLFTTYYNAKYTVPDWEILLSYMTHWDRLISSKKALK